jgi:hypothetical protein
MEMSSAFQNVNIWAVLLAAFVYLIIGSLWYSPLLFGNAWMKLIGFTEENFKSSKPIWMIMLVTYIFAFLAALSLSMFLGAKSDVLFGAIAGALVAAFWITTSKASNVLYENRPVKLWLLHAGFDFLAYVSMGAIIGGWH